MDELELKFGLDEYCIYAIKNCNQAVFDLVPAMKNACNMIAETSGIKLNIEHFGLFLDAYLKDIFRKDLKEELAFDIANGQYTNDFSSKFRTLTSREAIELCEKIDALNIGVSVAENDNTLKKSIFDVCASFATTITKYLEEMIVKDNILVIIFSYQANQLFPGAKIEFAMGCPSGYFYDIGAVIYSNILDSGIKMMEESKKEEVQTTSDISKEADEKVKEERKEKVTTYSNDDEDECGVYGVDF